MTPPIRAMNLGEFTESMQAMRARIAALEAEVTELRGRVERDARAAEAWEAVQEMGIDIEAWHDKNNWIAYYVGESLVDSNPIDAVLALKAKLERTNDDNS